jgi:hypothetical protein
VSDGAGSGDAPRWMTVGTMGDFAASVLLFLVWLALTLLAFLYLTLPAFFVATTLGTALGVAIAILGYLRVFAGAEPRVEIQTHKTLPPRRANAPYPVWDQGWPHYLAGQVGLDILAAVPWQTEVLRSVWRRALSLRRYGDLLLVCWPVVPPPVAFLLCVTAAAYLTWFVVALGLLGLTVVAWLAAAVLVAAMRAIDGALQWWRRASATCPTCGWTTHLPAYMCSNDHCDAIHNDLRPGALGVWWRRCTCGRLLPTTVLRAARALRPVCPRCRRALLANAGVTTDLRIPLSGGPGAGKTQLLLATLTALGGGSATQSTDWVPADPQSTEWLRRARRTITQGDPCPPTDPTKPPIRVSLQRHRARAYLHVLDAPGALYLDDRPDARLRFLGTTRTHLFALDPFTIPALRDRYGTRAVDGEADADWLASSARNGPTVAAAELPYHLMVDRLNGYGMESRRCRLAIVITRADLLEAAGIGPLEGRALTASRRLKIWLCDLGMDNLVLAAERDFGTVRYFLSDGSGGHVPPLDWLLRHASTPRWR